LNIPGADRLKTLGIGRHPEYDQAVLVVTETRAGMEGTVETIKFHGIKQRYQYVLILENGTPKMIGVNTWRDSAEKWEHRNAIQRTH
jgi:hypothetical protein